MPDGTSIQDRNPLTVPSTRRNPLLADIFERLGFMERRGSGFGKIIRSYELQVNFKEGKKPSFRSDRAFFTVILPNLNYGILQSGGQGDVPQGDVPQGDVPQGDIGKTIIRLIRENNKISTEAIAEQLSVSSKTIKRHIAAMSNIRYVGSGYSGHWEIIEE